MMDHFPYLCTRAIISFSTLFLSVLLSYKCAKYFNRHQSVNNHLWTYTIYIFLIRLRVCSCFLVLWFFFLEILTQCLLGIKGHLYHLHLTWKLSCLSYMILDIQFYRCSLLSWWCSLLFPSLSSIFDILCLNISEYVERFTLFLMEQNIRA